MINFEAPPKPEIASIENGILEVIHSELGKITIYENIILMEARPNVTISIKTGIFLLLKVVKSVGLRPMVYLSNRVNSYSVDPNDYNFLNLIPNLKAIGIVCYSDLAARTASLESKFIGKPNEIFRNLDDAHQWANDLLAKDLISQN